MMPITAKKHSTKHPDASASGLPVPLIHMKGIVKNFGRQTVLHGVDFELQPGEVHVLFGENGAGKSTLIQIVAGALDADAGDYVFCGTSASGLGAAALRMAGINTVFQEFSLVRDMTIADNLFLGRETTRFGRLARKDMDAAARRTLDRLGFDLDPNTRVGTLKRAHQQMVEIAKALLFEAKVIIFDEPTASLVDQEAQALFALIETLRTSGLGIIYITHRMPEIQRLADRVTVLRDGHSVKTFTGGDINQDSLVRSMTGRSIDKIYPKIPRLSGDPIVEISHLTLASKLVRDVDLTIRRGEVLGIAGLAGSGKSELIRALFGLETIVSGSVVVNGTPVTAFAPDRMLKKGVCYFPSDRGTEGLALRQSVKANCSMAALDQSRFSRLGSFIRSRSEAAFSADAIARLKIKTSSRNVSVDTLSGGNKQKVMIARGISRDIEVYLFDEPSVGVDIGAKIEIYKVIEELCAAGNAVVVVSSDLHEVMHLSHRLCVMHDGSLIAELRPDEVTEEAILSLFFGKADVDNQQDGGRVVESRSVSF